MECECSSTKILESVLSMLRLSKQPQVLLQAERHGFKFTVVSAGKDVRICVWFMANVFERYHWEPDPNAVNDGNNSNSAAPGVAGQPQPQEQHTLLLNLHTVIQCLQMCGSNASCRMGLDIVKKSLTLQLQMECGATTCNISGLSLGDGDVQLFHSIEGAIGRQIMGQTCDTFEVKGDSCELLQHMLTYDDSLQRGDWSAENGGGGGGDNQPPTNQDISMGESRCLRIRRIKLVLSDHPMLNTIVDDVEDKAEALGIDGNNLGYALEFSTECNGNRNIVTGVLPAALFNRFSLPNDSTTSPKQKNVNNANNMNNMNGGMNPQQTEKAGVTNPLDTPAGHRYLLVNLMQHFPRVLEKSLSIQIQIYKTGILVMRGVCRNETNHEGHVYSEITMSPAKTS